MTTTQIWMLVIILTMVFFLALSYGWERMGKKK